MSYWNHKVALVTGGSAGLGAALAAALAERGARVVISARRADALERVASALSRPGQEVVPLVADITVGADVDRLVAGVIQRFGRLDVLVNCAGRSARGEVMATTPEDFQSLLDLNFLAAVRVTRAAMGHLLAARGHVINIASLAAKSAAPFLGAYPASKFALAAYTQQLRLELAGQGLKVLLACPGPIARAEQRDYLPADAGLPDRARGPGGGVKLSALSPEHVAAAILRAAERNRAELVMPAKARLLFVLSQLSPRLGEWLVRRMT